jgi:hypothetical protein
MSIIVQRKHVVAPEDRAEYERMSSRGTWPTFLHFGSKMLAYGAWMFGGGPVDGVITHQAYADLTHWQATRARFAGRPGAFYEDEAIMAETAEVRELWAERGRLMRGTEARIIELDDEVSSPGVHYRSPDTPPADPPPTFGAGSVVSERTYRLAPGGEADFLRLSRDHVWPWLAQQDARMIAFGRDPLGPSDEVITMYAFRSLAEWQRLSRPSPELASDEVARAWSERSALIQRHQGRLLIVATDFGTPV